MAHEYDTWPSATWVPIPQRENQFNEDVMGPTSEVVEPPAQFDYSVSYVQMGYDQPTSQIPPTNKLCQMNMTPGQQPLGSPHHRQKMNLMKMTWDQHQKWWNHQPNLSMP